jgi:hypothetical protein
VRDSRALLIVLALVVVVAAAIWLALRRGPETPAPAPVPTPVEVERLEFDDLAVDSPDLAVGPARLRIAVQNGFSSWSLTTDCGEPDGCVGELSVEIGYDTGTDRGRVVLAGRFDTPAGGELRFEGLQDPATEVEGIDRVALEVRHRGPEADVISEPIQ